ncbi:hypothetical protein [Streptomyces sp. NPDC002851]
MSRRYVGRVRRTRRALWGVTLAAGLTALLAGCGIRPTEVPTDFGAAPSRVPCVTTEAEVAARPHDDGMPVQIYLVCGSQLVRVDRTVKLSGNSGANDRISIARALLDELRTQPTEAEDRAGFTSDVHGKLTVSGPRPGDDRAALRLSKPPEQMTPYELAQIVCTLAHNVATEANGSVILGGPGPDSPLRRYECTDELRSRPGTVPAPAETVG